MASDQGTKSGIQAAVATVGVERMQRAEQLALLPTDANVAEAGEADDVAQRAGPGRPAGSRNRRTSDWTDFILTRYRSPLLFLADTYTRPVDDLAREIGCDRDEALKIQIDAAKNLAPYVHQKQPVAVEVDGKGVVTLILEGFGGQPAALPGDAAVVIEGEIVNAEKSTT